MLKNKQCQQRWRRWMCRRRRRDREFKELIYLGWPKMDDSFEESLEKGNDPWGYIDKWLHAEEIASAEVLRKKIVECLDGSKELRNAGTKWSRNNNKGGVIQVMWCWFLLLSVPMHQLPNLQKFCKPAVKYSYYSKLNYINV